jgi:hypothetical protein
MSTVTAKQPKARVNSANKEIGIFIGELFSLNNSLKLYHWHVTGKGSYAQHIALDQAIDTLSGLLDRITETSYALKGDLDIVIPQTSVPGDIAKHAAGFYEYVDSKRDLFTEDFSKSILDDIQEAIQQLLFRLVRLQ